MPLTMRQFRRVITEAQMKAKSNSVVTTEVLESGSLRFTVLGAGEVMFNPANVHPANRAYAELHGWKQRIVDGAAISRDDVTGKPASPTDKLAAMQSLAEHYMSGAEGWSRAGTGGGGKSITLEAIARVSFKGDYEAAERSVESFAGEKFAGDRKKALAFLATGKRVMEMKAAIQAERTPAPKVDADAALNELQS